MKFIYLCAAIIVLSFTAVPAFYGVSEERDAILASNEQPTQEETIEVATEETFDANSLNEIAPAAGAQTDTGFSSGFSGVSDAAMTDFDPVAEAAETSEDVSNN
ncbi:MAG: hypothetical protein HRT94_02685 [Alphaproteobacteria bacterium]|nr:hypothetical protein [Alphaproteobacteria bacterium]